MKPYAGIAEKDFANATSKKKGKASWGPTPKPYDKFAFGKDMKKAYRSAKRTTNYGGATLEGGYPAKPMKTPKAMPTPKVSAPKALGAPMSSALPKVTLSAPQPWKFQRKGKKK